MTLKLTFKSEGSLLTRNAAFAKAEQFLIYSKGDIYLLGSGDMQLSDQVSGICSFPIFQYPNPRH